VGVIAIYPLLVLILLLPAWLIFRNKAVQHPIRVKWSIAAVLIPATTYLSTFALISLLQLLTDSIRDQWGMSLLMLLVLIALLSPWVVYFLFKEKHASNSDRH